MGERRGWFPEALVLIFALIVVAQVATYLLPTGEFERVVEGGKSRVVAGTFHAVSAEPLPWHAFLTSIPKGLSRASEVIFFVFLVGGVIGVLRAGGAIDALLSLAIRRAGHRPLFLLAGVTTLLSVGASTIGMTEEYVPFVPILVSMCVALGFDAIVAVGIVYVASGIGYAAAAHNPFTVLIAQRIAGLELNSGAAWRWGLWCIALTIGIAYLARYARRVKLDPSRSLVAGLDTSSLESVKPLPVRPAHGVVLGAFAAGIAWFVWGSSARGWELVELGAILLGGALIAAALAPLTPNHAAREFCRGAAELTTTALLIGFAKTIQVILEDGRCIDAVVNALASSIDGLGADAGSIGMLALQSATNLLVPSGSAQAYVTMPLMTPVADLTGIPRQTAVLAYQCGDGLTNMVIPTNSVLMGVLALGRVPYSAWLRFILPLVAVLFVLFALALVVANRFGVGG